MASSINKIDYLRLITRKYVVVEPSDVEEKTNNYECKKVTDLRRVYYDYGEIHEVVTNCLNSGLELKFSWDSKLMLDKNGRDFLEEAVFVLRVISTNVRFKIDLKATLYDGPYIHDPINEEDKTKELVTKSTTICIAPRPHCLGYDVLHVPMKLLYDRCGRRMRDMVLFHLQFTDAVFTTIESDAHRIDLVEIDGDAKPMCESSVI